MVIPLLEPLALSGKTITTDALLTQRKLAAYLREHHAHYVFTVKDNQPGLAEAIRLLFAARGAPDFQEPPTLAHGRIESHAIWTSTRLNEYLDFPAPAQICRSCDSTFM
jgi:predicted transposase YbfD/YdcC